jgi:undecaprenyl-diphosphatase
MPIWEAAVLGLVQGLAEFLPISSSGHLVLLHALFGVAEEGALAFDVLLHLGTLVAVLVYFRKDWLALARSALRAVTRFDWADPDVRFVVFLGLATVPGALAGALLEHTVDAAFHNADRGPLIVAVALGVMGLVLLAAERVAKHTRGAESMTWVDALLIGVSQALALVPGVSRSGATMTTALFLGLRRDDAARFSFMLSAPIIAGAGLMHLPKLVTAGSPEGPGALAAGFLVSLVSGYAAISFLMQYVRTRSFNIFGYYRVAVAGVILLALLLR